MSIKKQTALFIMLVLLSLAGMVYVLTRILIMDEYLAIEADYNLEKRTTLAKMVDAELKRLETLTKDWAIWDDSYAYVDNRNAAFVKSSFGTLGDINSDLDTNLIYFFDRSGEPIHGEYYPYAGEKTAPLPYNPLKAFFEGDGYARFLDAGNVRHAILGYRGHLLLAAVHPVTDSNAEARSNGAVLFGRYLDSALLSTFSESLSNTVTMTTDTSGNGPFFCDETHCTNTVRLEGSDGREMGALIFTTERDFYYQGKKLVHHFMLMFLLLLGVTIGALWFFLQRNILSRLQHLASGMSRMVVDGRTPKHLPVEGNDEITALSDAANQMLAKIDAFQNKQAALAEQARLVAMGKIVRDIAHHWRQPLTVLAGHCQSIKMDYDEGTLDAKRIEDISAKSMEQILGMSRVINSFQDFYEIRTKTEPFELAKIVEQALLTFQPQIEGHGIHISLPEEKGPCTIFASPPEIAHLISALVENAIDSLVRECPEDNRTIGIDWEAHGRTVTLTICDNGTGIPEEIRERIFDPYFSTKTNRNGTGLGLYMAKMIAEHSMNGTLELGENRPGRCCFKLTLPFQ